MGQEKTIINRQFGSIVIDMDRVVTFPEGIFGFEDIREYAIIDFEEYHPFQWLVALNNPDILFPIISPILVKQDYAPPITLDALNKIGEFTEKDLLIYAIITLKPKGEKTTANLKGPIVINQKNQIGQQVILESDEFSLSQPLF